MARGCNANADGIVVSMIGKRRRSYQSISLLKQGHAVGSHLGCQRGGGGVEGLSFLI